MGRKAMPIELLLIQGNKNKLTKEEIDARRKAEEKLKPKADNIRPPSHLSSQAKKHFKKLVKELSAIDLMTNVDVDILAWYCDANDRLIREKTTLSIREYDTLVKLVKSVGTEFGFTPSSRAGLAMPKEEEKPKSTEEKMFGDV